MQVDGILNLNKPKGWTSHDVVAHVRRLTGIRRVGHCGTLDPLATGVLLICLGRATRIAEYLMLGRKRYRAELRLGVSTDSHDANGQVTATSPVTVGVVEVDRVLAHFRGQIEQVPPMVSAIKQDGQRLYRLARRGVKTDRAARPAEIFELDLIDWQPPHLSIELVCTPGTYVRALARDLGQRLGCGAHVTELARLASGEFTLNDAIELAQLNATISTAARDHVDTRLDSIPDCAQSAADGAPGRTEPAQSTPGWHQLVLPIDAALEHLPACVLGAQQTRSVRSGQSLPAELVASPRDQLCRAYADSSQDFKFLALLRFDEVADLWWPHKVFHPL